MPLDTRPVIAVSAHLADILSAAHPLAPEERPLDRARGRVLRHPVRAAVDVPGFDNSAMDGFAVRHDDVTVPPASLRVVADLPAGAPDDPALPPGVAARIMTGAPVPTDATAIVPFEDTRDGLVGSLTETTVLAAPRASGAHIRRRGSDTRAGEVVVAAGLRLTATRIAAIAASGVPVVWVTRAPRVAVISTGSELVAPGMPLRRGQIPESNSFLLAGLAEEAGAEVVLRASISDDGDGPRAMIADAERLGADVVVFSGGVSAGAYEVVKNGLGDLLSFVQVAMQPARPQGFGRTPSGTLVFGLPGNPVSAAVSFEVFVRPALRALEGDVGDDRVSVRAPLADGWRVRSDRLQFVPVRIDRTDATAWRAVPPAPGARGSTRGLGDADGYAVIPPGDTDLVAGDVVEVRLV